MVFSSNVFLFLFLPLFLAVYYLTPNRGRARNSVVLIGSYLFYAWWRLDFLMLFASVTVWNYFVGLSIARVPRRSPAARRRLIIGVAGNLLTLAYFKYANFGVSSINDALAATGGGQISWLHVILPIGISFYIFESISYIADVYRGDTEATHHPVDFATFIALFPHLIAGPVFRYKDLADQFVQREHSWEKFGEGSVRFMQGFIKKVLIADAIAPLANSAFALTHPHTADAWLGALAYTAQLYFDFSGYSDMAIGLGLMMGFRFVENFNQPYISQSITEFWRRWHMSLSAWLRDYLYIALGGNRKGRARTYINLLLTMLLGGLWHGASWNFLIWGGWHGSMLAVERAAGVKAESPRFRLHRWALTFLLVVLGWVMFRAPTVTDAFHVYRAMFDFHGHGLSDVYAGSITSLQVITLGLAIVVTIATGAASLRPAPRPPVRARGHLALQWLVWPVFVLAILKLSAQSYSPFLYFQF
ncbi:MULTISPECIES: MBOAT family O-acyltransferase [Dyella]|uniref:Probable alginate O-acetylase n=2 Tax=Dyella TaxID=231454 RepID=A0A4R0Z3M8_9GAMM|nr:MULTISPECIES: MBOAT family protein [Dyella]TBR39444.1 MBOAT family protein [Dyella terrae]TCI12970.1 MBOAT family protein [Dyella soli]